MVALFFPVIGYVNAMKPIKQARSGNYQPRSGEQYVEEAWPAITATVTSSIICGHEIATVCEAAWIRQTSPNPVPGNLEPIQSLVVNSFTTLSTCANVYDPVQWTLLC